MARYKVIVPFATVERVFHEGDLIELEPDKARGQLAAGHIVPVDEPPAQRAAAVETAEAAVEQAEKAVSRKKRG
jgi:hypothetical protein